MKINECTLLAKIYPMACVLLLTYMECVYPSRASTAIAIPIHINFLKSGGTGRVAIVITNICLCDRKSGYILLYCIFFHKTRDPNIIDILTTHWFDGHYKHGHPHCFVKVSNKMRVRDDLRVKSSCMIPLIFLPRSISNACHFS